MTVENLEFKAEVNQLLDLVIHSLYSHKEIFLRELISNASDAIDKARYESLTNPTIQEDGGSNWKIKIIPDKIAGTLTISDNGIGMNHEEVVKELGTIAHSGTTQFLKNLKEKNVATKDATEFIGQFGVGFYSAFMVADQVTVISRKAGSGTTAIKWESQAKGSFTVDHCEKATRGTDVIIKVKDEEKKYLDSWEIRTVVRKYSDYIEYPIVMDVEHEKESELEKGQKYKVTEEETINSQKAIWLRDKSEITEQEYNDFYKHISHDFTDPAKVIHYKAEGTSEFNALIYIPSSSPFDIFHRDFKIGPALYVKRVQIMDHCEELIPRYLRFVKGVIDSSDLPLNVSRELLQNNRQVEIINKNVTKKVLDTLADLQKNDPDKYKTLYSELGRVIKEGIHFDFERREPIADLLLFESTKTQPGEHITLKEYVDRMKSDQEDVYFMIAMNRSEAEHSPYLETFKEKDFEVLLMSDEVDDLIFNSFDYKGKKFKSVIKGDISLDKGTDEEKKKSEEKYKKLIDLIKDSLKDDVKDVRISGRLKDSPCCLVADEGAMDPGMEKVLRSLGRDMPQSKKILEINPTHKLIETMDALFEKDPLSSKLADYIKLLYDQSLILEGEKPKDAATFSKMLASLMVNGAK